jgi:hypothetical protein
MYKHTSNEGAFRKPPSLEPEQGQQTSMIVWGQQEGQLASYNTTALHNPVCGLGVMWKTKLQLKHSWLLLWPKTEDFRLNRTKYNIETECNKVFFFA